MDEDDEDAEALKAVYGKHGGAEAQAAAAAADVEAKVRVIRSPCSYHTINVRRHYRSQSIKCSECGKIFRNTALAQFHAEKSGHDQFEESTEEVRLALLPFSKSATCSHARFGLYHRSSH